MSSAIANNLLVVFVLLTCGFAFWKGGAAERIGAGIILANLLAGIVNEATIRESLVHLAIAGITALVLLAAAVRYANFWLGGVMLLYALQFALDAYYAVLALGRDVPHMVINNVLFFAIALCLGAGAFLSWRKRIRMASSPAA